MPFNKILSVIIFSVVIACSTSAIASGTHPGGHESEVEQAEKKGCAKNKEHAHSSTAKHGHPENDADQCNKNKNTGSQNGGSH